LTLGENVGTIPEPDVSLEVNGGVKISGRIKIK
jgi:hypothetical protein